MRYAAHDPFIAAARARPALWRLVLGTVLVLICFALFPLPLFGLVVLIGGTEALRDLFRSLVAIDTPGATLLVLMLFAGMVLGTALAVRLLHRRGAASLFGPWPRLWRHFLIATAIALAVFALSLLIPSDVPVSENLPPQLWALFLMSGLAALLLQTGAEEMLFRGYLQQQLAALFRSPLAWAVLPSGLFAIGHPPPPELGAQGWLLVLLPGLFGLLAADLTAATGSLGAAWGFHFANNMVSLLAVGVSGQITGLALYVAEVDLSDTRALLGLMASAALTTLAIWAAIRFALTRRRRVPADAATTPAASD